MDNTKFTTNIFFSKLVKDWPASSNHYQKRRRHRQNFLNVRKLGNSTDKLVKKKWL